MGTTLVGTVVYTAGSIAFTLSGFVVAGSEVMVRGGTGGTDAYLQLAEVEVYEAGKDKIGEFLEGPGILQKNIIVRLYKPLDDHCFYPQEIFSVQCTSTSTPLASLSPQAPVLVLELLSLWPVWRL